MRDFGGVARVAFVLCACVPLVSCGVYYSQTRAERSVVEELRRAPSIDVVRYARPYLITTSPAEAFQNTPVAQAVFGASLPPAEQFVAQYRIEHPSVAMERSMVEGLKARAGLTNLKARGEALAKDIPKPADLASQGQHYVLELPTPLVMLTYQALKRDTFDVQLAGQVRLVRSSDGRMLWSAKCDYGDDQDSSLILKRDELLRDDAAVFKAALERAAKGCVDQILGTLPT